MNRILEKEKELKVVGTAQVVVVGGGPAGVAAATTAAEMGAKTIVIEKNGFFGGSNVAGYSGTIGGLFSSSADPQADLEQIVHGFAGRFADRLEEEEGLVRMERFGHTALAPHDPTVWMRVADEFVTEAGADIFFHTLFVDVVKEGDRVIGIIIENKDGRGVILGDFFIDASGDADFSHRAGAQTYYGKDGAIQAMTKVFRLGNVNWSDIPDFSLEKVWDQVAISDKDGSYNLPRKHPFIFRAPQKNQAIMNCTAIIAEDKRILYPTIAKDLTEAELQGRRQMMEYAGFAKDYLEGFQESYVMDSAPMVGIRQSRSVVGDYTLTNEDVVSGRKFQTAIVRSAWPIEVHGGTDGVKIVNLDDDFYEIPFETMIPKGLSQVLVAGRCISAEHEALASARVVAQCFEEGMAAGLGAYLSLTQGVDIREVSVQEIRSMMMDNGSNL